MMAIRTVLGLLVIATVSSGAPQFPKELNFIDAREVTSRNTVGNYVPVRPEVRRPVVVKPVTQPVVADSYTYSYKINHPPKETYIAKTESREGKLVQGQYSYVDTEGSLVTVQYEADEDGFRETRNLQPNFLKTYSGDLESLFGPVIPAEPAPRAVVYNKPAPKPIEAPKTFVYNKPAPKPVVYAKPAPKPVLAFKPAPPPAPKAATNNKDLVAQIISQLTPFIKDSVLEGVSDEDLRRKSSFLNY